VTPAPEPGRFRITGDLEVGALYPGFYYTSLDTIAALPASALVEAVLDGPPGHARGPCPIAQFVVSTDAPERFDPDLSMREPLELQVWADGSFAVEIEFTGDDISAAPAAAEPAMGDTVGQTLAEWAAARSWRLDGLYNDLGRSLSNVWNARFVMPDTSACVGSAVDFAGHAIGVAESCRLDGRPAGRVLALLRAGDAAGLLGAPTTAVFQPLPGLLPQDEPGRFEIASQVCAFANSVTGGVLVLGLEQGSGPSEGRVAAARPFPIGQGPAQLADILRLMVFPPPAELIIEAVPAGADEGFIAISIPPQDRLLKPFLVHGALVGGRYQAQFASIVERRGVTVYAQPIAALHGQIAAGQALLRGGQSGMY
jgi:hypothetical protein